jgi:hypothetical protein
MNKAHCKALPVFKCIRKRTNDMGNRLGDIFGPPDSDALTVRRSKIVPLAQYRLHSIEFINTARIVAWLHLPTSSTQM